MTVTTAGVPDRERTRRRPVRRGRAGLRLVAAMLLVGVLTACGEDRVATTSEDTAPTSSPSSVQPDAAPEPSPSATVQPSGQGTKVIASDSDFGTILFDETGQAIYVFDVETTSRPRCYGPCAEAWPPVLTEDPPVAGRRVSKALLGTTPRTDGTTQVTYDGHPLYFYAHEGKDEVKCHDVVLNGGTWYAVQPDGNRAP